MPIAAQEIIDRVRQVGLDAEGADYYDDTLDIIPAINAAVEWLTAVINSAFGQKKMGEEVFQDLVHARVFQTSDFSRVYFNSTDLGHELWTILGVYISPTVRGGGTLNGTLYSEQASLTTPLAIIQFEQELDLIAPPIGLSIGQQVDFTYIDKTTGNTVVSTFTVVSINNTGNQVLFNILPITDLGVFLDSTVTDGTGHSIDAKSIYTGSYTTSLPKTISTSTPETSLYRKDLAHLSSEKSAKRLTIEEWAKNTGNPFAPGNNVLSANCDTLEYAYLNYSGYSAPDVPYSAPTEIEIRPSVANDVVTIFYSKKPSKIVQATDNIEYPAFFANWIYDKTLQYISFKQGDGTTIHTVTSADINTLLQSIA
tara:strand:+ start:13473 stop:14576 length:1104 start_codon:yes stop_codon:yes gene_type:complete